MRRLARIAQPTLGRGPQLEAAQAERIQGVAGFSSPHKLRNNEKAACHIDTGGSYGSGSLVDGTPVGFPAACILTNQHVIGTAVVARGTTVRFNYDTADSSRWIEVRLDPAHGFLAHKDADIDFCLVAVAPADTDNLTKTLSKAHVSEFPAAVEMHADAPVSMPMPITIWQHPSGGSKQHSSWTLDSFTDKGLTYQNDTLPGSSGSPIFNNTGDLIGIHYAGEVGRANYGCRLSAVLAFIQTDPRAQRQVAVAAAGRPSQGLSTHAIKLGVVVVVVLLLVAAIFILEPVGGWFVKAWLYASPSEACSAVCSSAGMWCEDGDWGVHDEQSLRMVLEAAGQSPDVVCPRSIHDSVWTHGQEPFVRVTTGDCVYCSQAGGSTGQCSMSTSCSARTSKNYRRLCRCVSPPGPWHKSSSPPGP
eukprot:COSAG02_NODE_2306_length_9174_cov_10.715152_6_plen_418_part_00